MYRFLAVSALSGSFNGLGGERIGRNLPFCLKVPISFRDSELPTLEPNVQSLRLDGKIFYFAFRSSFLKTPPSHATELVNGGVSLGTIRKRLGHCHIQTTLRYAEVSDASADAELRKWRRKQQKTP